MKENQLQLEDNVRVPPLQRRRVKGKQPEPSIQGTGNVRSSDDFDEEGFAALAEEGGWGDEEDEEEDEASEDWEPAPCTTTLFSLCCQDDAVFGY